MNIYRENITRLIPDTDDKQVIFNVAVPYIDFCTYIDGTYFGVVDISDSNIMTIMMPRFDLTEYAIKTLREIIASHKNNDVLLYQLEKELEELYDIHTLDEIDKIKSTASLIKMQRIYAYDIWKTEMYEEIDAYLTDSSVDRFEHNLDSGLYAPNIRNTALGSELFDRTITDLRATIDVQRTPAVIKIVE